MQVIETKGVNQTKAEQMIGLSVGTIGKLQTRKEGFGQLHDDNVGKFLRTFNVNPDWWKNGEGEMFLEKVAEPAIKYETVDELRKTIAAHEKTISAMEKTILLMEKSEQSQDRLLNEYRQQLMECREALSKVKQNR